jgi:hypothetical protein
MIGAIAGRREPQARGPAHCLCRRTFVSAIRALVFLMTLALPALASGQSFELFGSAGPTLTDLGNSVAAGAGFSPTSRVTIAGTFERTHLSSRIEQHASGSSAFRGGTLYLGSGEVRVAPLGRTRIGPYGLAGFAAGVSHPNVNERFPDRVSNGVRALFFGGGLQVPIRDRLAAFVDLRIMFGAEGTGGLVGVAPLRGGVAWRW